jgi:16S rRNA (uracil1498-N3)-methyltransferase
MPQFFVPPEALAKGTFRLDGPEAFHVTKVLRYRPGQSVILFDGQGGRFEAVIKEIHPDGSVTGALTGTLHAKDSRKPVELRLYQGLLKSGHWDMVLEKGTELGVSVFVPVLTPRTVVLLNEAERVKSKAERWGRILQAASKQCGRAALPVLGAPAQFRDAVKECQGKGLTLLAWEGLSGATAAESVRLTLREADQGRGGEALRVNLFIGPEGGFSEEEVELAESLGVVVFGLGRRILRAETAAIAAVALLQYEFSGL